MLSWLWLLIIIPVVFAGGYITGAIFTLGSIDDDRAKQD